jgi:N-acetylated-alpha-linked acidic dipeptidase
MMLRRVALRFASCGVLVSIPCLASAPDAAGGAALLGYSAQGAVQEQQWEQKFQAAISPDNIRENMRRLSARPHHVGSPYDKDNAEWILAHFKEWGFDARIETFNVLFPTPKVRVLEMLEPTSFRASLQSRRSPSIPPRVRPRSSCRPTTRIPRTAT